MTSSENLPADTIKDLAISRRVALGALAGAALPARAQNLAVSPAADIDTDTWGWTKAQQMLDPRWAYFDTAQFAPTTRAVMATEYRAREALNTDPVEFFASRYNPKSVTDTVLRITSRMGCAPDELALVRSAGAGLEQFRRTLRLQSGDELLINAQLPAALRTSWSAWAAQCGVLLKTVQLPMPLTNPQQVIDAFTTAFTERTRALLISHVQPDDGAVLPVTALSQLARERNALMLIEGSCAVGVLPFQLQELGCDVYAANLSNWMAAPTGTGFLYVRRELHERFEAITADLPYGIDSSGWPALMQRLPQDFIEYAAAFQGVPPALALHERLTRTRIETRLRDLATYARLRLQTLQDIEVLTPAAPGMFAAVLALRSGQRSAERITAQLRQVDRVVAHAFTQQPSQRAAVRVSLHVFNNHDEIERLAMGLQRALRT